MRLDYSAVEVFIEYYEGRGNIIEVINNPAYKTIFSHSQIFGTGFDEKALELSVINDDFSPLLGYRLLGKNLSSIKRLIDYIKEKEEEWLKKVDDVLKILLPEEDNSNIVIYPVIGYKEGIGHKDVVCINVNKKYFFYWPWEFLYFIIHGCIHALYERIHPILAVDQLKTQEDRLNFFYTMLQNEGYAIYGPLSLRKQNGHIYFSKYPVLQDYYILFNERELIKHTRMYDTLVLDIVELDKMRLEEYLAEVFSEHRIINRIGCTIIRLMEKKYGSEEVQKAFYLSGSEFVKRYDHLLGDFRF